LIQLSFPLVLPLLVAPWTKPLHIIQTVDCVVVEVRLRRVAILVLLLEIDQRV
jgi:hypothetical protein